MNAELRGVWLAAVVVLLALPNGQPAWGAEEATPRDLPVGTLVELDVPELPRIGLWHTKATLPAPTLFVFSATIEESLEDPYFRQCGNALAEQGYLLVSLDLPGHGTEHRADEPGGLAAWRSRSDAGEDFVAPFVDKARRVLDHLIEAGYTDPGRIAACGTSRGGFMALQFAAAESRIRATAAFAPVTNLMALREFDGAENAGHVTRLSLLSHAEKLAGSSLWLIIGDRDERVSTDDCIAFARQVTTLSLDAQKEPDVTLTVQPEPKGHTTPQGAPEKAAVWIGNKLK